MLYYIGKFILTALFKIFGRLTVVGREQVPRQGGVVLAANHVSYADPPLIGCAAPRKIRFMAKSELFSNRFFAALISAVGAFPVRRGVADRQALRTAQELLTGGDAMVIFIEGRRSADGILQPPELGTAMIALRAGVPIVPVALINSDRFLPYKSKWLHWSHVKVVFAEPLLFPHLAGKEGDRAALQEVSYAVARRIAELLRAHGAAERVPEGYGHA